MSFDYVQWDVIVFQRISYTEHIAICDTKYVYIPWSVCIWTSHIILRFLMHVAEGLNYRGFALAPCNVSLYAIAMLSLDHRLVRLTIDMLLHFYMHKWKHSLFRLQVRVQLVLGGLVYTIALQSVKNRLTAWKQEVVATECSESVHLTWHTCNLASSIIFLQSSLAQRIWQKQ